jgi:hypothetical protein
VEETRDRQGKVTSHREYHYVLATYSGRGYCKMVGPRGVDPITAKQIEEKKAKQAAINKQIFKKCCCKKTDRC